MLQRKIACISAVFPGGWGERSHTLSTTRKSVCILTFVPGAGRSRSPDTPAPLFPCSLSLPVQGSFRGVYGYTQPEQGVAGTSPRSGDVSENGMVRQMAEPVLHDTGTRVPLTQGELHSAGTSGAVLMTSRGVRCLADPVLGHVWLLYLASAPQPVRRCQGTLFSVQQGKEGGLGQ